MHTLMSVLYTGFNQIFNQISRHMQCIIEISNCVDIRMRQCLAKVLFRDEQERLDLLLGTECIKRNRIGNRSLDLAFYRCRNSFWSELCYRSYRSLSRDWILRIAWCTAGKISCISTSILFLIAKKFNGSDSTVRSVSKSEKTDRFPVTESAKNIILCIIQIICDHGDAQRRCSILNMTEKKKVYFYKLSVRIRHIMIYKAVRQHCHIHLKIIL